MAVRRYRKPPSVWGTRGSVVPRTFPSAPRPGAAPGGRVIGGGTPAPRQLAPAVPSQGPSPWGVQAPPAPQAPPAQAPQSSAPATAPVPQGAVVDSAYLAWRAGREAEMAQQRIAYDSADQTDNQTRAEALRRLALQRPESLQNADVAANRRGLFYSTGLGKQKDQIQADFTQREADTNTRFQISAEGRRAARMAYGAGFSKEDAAQILAAADRATARDQEAAAANALAVNPTDPGGSRGCRLAPGRSRRGSRPARRGRPTRGRA
jgi:hypothetical protein